jgi:hypothetical protein
MGEEMKIYLSKGKVLEAYEVSTLKDSATISVKNQMHRLRKILRPLIGKTVKVYIEVINEKH